MQTEFDLTRIDTFAIEQRARQLRAQWLRQLLRGKKVR